MVTWSDETITRALKTWYDLTLDKYVLTHLFILDTFIILGSLVDLPDIAA